MTAGTLECDSGNYAAALDKAKELIGYDALRQERQAEATAGATASCSASRSPAAWRSAGWAPSQVLGTLHYAGGWLSVPRSAQPHWQGHGDQRDLAPTVTEGHDTAFARIVADALGSPPTTSRCCTAVPPVATWGLRLLRNATACRSRGVTIQQGGRAGTGEGRGADRPQLEAGRGRPRVDRRQVPGQGRPRPGQTVPELAFSSWAAHNLPEGVDPILEGSAALRPAQLDLPVRDPHLVVEVDGRPGRPGSTSSRGRGRLRRHRQPADRRRPGG